MKILLFLITIIFHLNCFSQERYDSLKVPYGLSPSEWGKISRVWRHKSKLSKIVFTDNNTMKGQIISINNSFVIFWNHNGFPDMGGSSSRMLYLSLDTIKLLKASRIPAFRNGLIWGGIIAATAGTIIVGVTAQGWVPAVIGVGAAPAGVIPGGIINRFRLDKRVFVSSGSLNHDLKEYYKLNYVFYPNSTPAFLTEVTSENREKLSIISFDTILQEAGRAKDKLSKTVSKDR
jgi:hypothetical protein